MSMYTKEEFDKLSVMYDGDKDRDATSKIRGFLFQDYITIMCLLQNQVKYVCSEYLEDVDVFFEDGTFEIIQVKYYPKTNPNIKEISTDLYYQYLRLQMLQSTLTAVPKLYIHRKSKVNKPTLDEMKTYIGLAFMDLLKYQMSSKATMEQLFFITSNERISKLLKYKLSGRGIELCELLEADFM